MRADDRDLIQRMLETSESYRSAHDELTGTLTDFGPAPEVLATLAFEVALKAVWRVAHATKPKFNHRYDQGFVTLTGTFKARLLSHANRIECGLDLTEASFLVVCKDIKRVFEQYRYDYECFEDAGGDFVQKGRKWASGSAKEEEAEFRFRPCETRAITLAMHGILRDWLKALP